MTTNTKPIGIYYEHPDWFRPLFAELDRRGLPYIPIDARRHVYNPASREESATYALVFNRMSPSAYLRNGGNSLFYTTGWLAHLEQQGLRVINGYKAFTYEINKALQLQLMRSLGIPYPAAQVINHPDLAPAAG